MISQTEIIVQLFLSMALGGLIGLERERKSWFAGLRTHMLVCIGSTLIMIVSQYGFASSLKTGLIELDPSRMAAQVVSGIGFLGAGTILFWNNMIRGLTTAASLWAVAAIGLAVGGALYVAAIVTTGLILIVLAGIKPLEKFYLKTAFSREVKFSIQTGLSLIVLQENLKKFQLASSLKNLEIQKDGMKEIINLSFIGNEEANFLEFIDDLKSFPGVEKVEIIEN